LIREVNNKRKKGEGGGGGGGKNYKLLFVGLRAHYTSYKIPEYWVVYE